MDIPCKLTDRIECGCGRCALLQELMFVPWQRLFEPGGVMSQAGYFYCLSCQSLSDIEAGKAKPIDYRQGGHDDNPRIVLSDPDFTKVLGS